jgi:microcystin-dependent protein
MFAGNFAPRAWAFCDGQLLAVSQNDALFSLLGTVYGGDGRTTFGLPDLRGRVPVHAGTGPGLSARRLGERGGTERVTLTVNELPGHGHELRAVAAAGAQATPSGAHIANSAGGSPFVSPAQSSTVAMNANVVQSTGGSQAHNNMMPSLCVNYIIALFGIYPSRS